MQYYFSYPSNLHHNHMKRRCPKSLYINKHILKNYQLTFIIKYGSADIEKIISKHVYWDLYVISKVAEKRLDVYEEYPTLYKKMYFKFINKKVMTYIMPKKIKLVPPTAKYLNTIKQGYTDRKLNMTSKSAALLPVKHLQR